MKKKILGMSAVGFIILLGVICLLLRNQKVSIEVSVPNYYALASFSYNGDFNEFYKDSYDWYQLIENEEGVYIINTSYNSEELLKLWREENIYQSVPDQAFWEFTASPSYLEQIGVKVDEQDLEDAKKGVRLYLVPDTLKNEEFETMKSYLEECALYAVEESLITTNFVNEKEVKVVQYTPKDSYFTWPSEKGEPVTDAAPVIYVCTSENMKYYESESLIATGINSYLKFADRETMEKLTKADSLKKYDLNFITSDEIYKKAARSKLVDSGIEKVFEKIVE